MFTAVINLREDVERMRRMDTVLTGMALPYSRIEGLRASGLPPEIRERFRGALTDPELGCMEGHVSAWRAFLESNEELCLVLEDDVHFAPAFRGFVEALAAAPVRPGVIKLETMLARVTLGRTPVFAHDQTGIYPLHSNHGGTAAYIMNRETARLLIEQRPKFHLAVDTEIFDPQRRQTRTLETFQVYPALCIQDFLLGESGVLRNKSNIGILRADATRAGVDSPLVRGLRPLYTAAYSAGLGLAGRWRVDVAAPSGLRT